MTTPDQAAAAQRHSNAARRVDAAVASSHPGGIIGHVAAVLRAWREHHYPIPVGELAPKLVHIVEQHYSQLRKTDRDIVESSLMAALDVDDDTGLADLIRQVSELRATTRQSSSCDCDPITGCPMGGHNA